MTRTYRIVVGIDGSDSGHRALAWAVAEAAHRTESGQPTSVRAITAYEYVAGPMGTGPGLPDPAKLAEQTVAAAIAVAQAVHPGVHVAGDAVNGAAPEVLGRAAADTDILVLGSHGHSRRHTAVLGSVSEACVRIATCPVLIIPAAHPVSRPLTGESLAAIDRSTPG